MDRALQMIARHAEDGARLRREFFAAYGESVAEAARRMAVAVARGGKVLLAGNGGSAADAQHWAAEFVNRFLMDRPPLPAMALTTDHPFLPLSAMTLAMSLCLSNRCRLLAEPGTCLSAFRRQGTVPMWLEPCRRLVDRDCSPSVLPETEVGGWHPCAISCWPCRIRPRLWCRKCMRP